MTTPNGGVDADIDLNIAKARQTFGIVNKIWMPNEISKTLKLYI